MAGPVEVLLSAEELAAAVTRMAAGIDDAFPGERPVLIGVLKGSVVVMADLCRAMKTECEVDFLSLSAFGGKRVRIESDISIDIEDRRVVIVEDIVDTGLSLTWLLRTLGARHPKSLDVAALLDRRVRRLVEVPVRWAGAEVDDRFVVGYGMDFEGRYRNVRDVLVVDSVADLVADPDCLVPKLYGGW